MPNIIDDTPADTAPDIPVSSEQLARRRSIRQIERRRRFRIKREIDHRPVLIIR